MLSVAYTKRQHAVHPLKKVETMGSLKRKARNPDGRLTAVSPNACLIGPGACGASATLTIAIEPACAVRLVSGSAGDIIHPAGHPARARGAHLRARRASPLVATH